MAANLMPNLSVPAEVGRVVWRIFGAGASPCNRLSSYALIEPIVRKHIPAPDRAPTIAALRGWFELHADQRRLRPHLDEPVAALILDGIRTERSDTAVWAAGSIDAERAVNILRSGWFPSEIDSFAEAALATLGRLSDSDAVVNAAAVFPDLDATNARIPKSAVVHTGRLETFRHLAGHRFELVFMGLHAPAGRLIALLVALRPEQFKSLIARLDHPVMQARAAHHMLDAALPLDHRTTLNWITADSCDDLVALAIVHTLNTVNKLDQERRSAARADVDRDSWSTELRPPRDDLNAAAASLLTDLVERLAVLDPLPCVRWTGELLSGTPYMLHGGSTGDGGKPHRIHHLEQACTTLLARLARQSWSDDMLAALCTGLRLTPRNTWTRHIADVAWALRETAPDCAAEIGGATLAEHERHVAEELQRGHFFLNWSDWHDREWLSGLGISLALSIEDLSLADWVSSKCRDLPLSVWDAEEDCSAFSTADRVAQHWFLIAFRTMPALKQLGRAIDSATVRSLAETLWSHCRFAQRHLHGAPEDSVTAEHAARFVVELGEPSDTWLLDQARHPGVGPRSLWALADQRRLKSAREDRAHEHHDEVIAAELIRIASDRFDERVHLDLDPLRFWGRLWLLLDAADAAQRTATAIIAFPQRMQDRADRILVLKLLALAATKREPAGAIKDYIASGYRQLWPGYTPEAERADRQEIDGMLKRSEPGIL